MKKCAKNFTKGKAQVQLFNVIALFIFFMSLICPASAHLKDIKTWHAFISRFLAYHILFCHYSTYTVHKREDRGTHHRDGDEHETVDSV